jgi:hypothetical protein
MSTVMSESFTDGPGRTRSTLRPVRGAADVPTEHLAVIDRIRAAGIAIGPSLLLDLAVAAGTAAVATGWAFRPRTGPGRLVRPLAVLGAAFPWAYFLAIRPWHRRWGATAEEVGMPLPGDDLVPDPGYQHTRAVTIHAAAEDVWPWLAQIGQDRGGFYSYEWLENLAGCAIRNADRVHPEWQDVKAGDPLAIVRGWGTKLAAVEPGRALVIDGWGTYAVREIDANTSRLVARARQPRGWASLAYLLTVEIPHFVMERKMLLGIKERAERATDGPSLLDGVLPRYDYGGSVSTVIHAPPAAIFRALREVTLAEMPLAHALGTLRYLPGRLTGRVPPQPGERTRPFLELLTGPVLAEDPDREVVIGTVGRLHDLLDQQFVPLDGRDAFDAFDRPDFEKFAQSFRIAGGSEATGYRLLAEHRTLALDPGARRRFAWYWYLLVGRSGNWLLRMLLEAVKRRAERGAGGDATVGAGLRRDTDRSTGAAHEPVGADGGVRW